MKKFLKIYKQIKNNKCKMKFLIKLKMHNQQIKLAKIKMNYHFLKKFFKNKNKKMK